MVDEKKNSRSLRKKAEKRKLILDAACEIFTRDGYHNARVEAIATQAGIGKGTVYEYFASKQELFQKMLEEKNILYRQIMFQSDTQDQTLEESLYCVVKNHIEISIKNKRLTFLIMQELPFMDQPIKDWFLSENEKREREFREYMESFIQTKMIRNVNIDALVFLFFGIMASLEWLIVMGKWQGDIEQVARSISDIILHGIERKE